MSEVTVANGVTAEVEMPDLAVEVDSPSWDYDVETPRWTFEIAAPELVGAATPVPTELEVLLLPGPRGPEGPEGPEGPPGSGVERLFVVSIPDVLWQLPHALGRWVDVQAFDSNGEEIFGDVTLLDGLVEIRWYYPTAGSARVST